MNKTILILVALTLPLLAQNPVTRQGALNTRFYAHDTGGDDTYVVATPTGGGACPAALADGLTVEFVADITNTDDASLNFCGLGALEISAALAGTNLTSGDLVVGKPYLLRFYDSTPDLWIVTLPGAGGGGGLSGTKALSTSAISSGTCSSAQTSTATGLTTADVLLATFNADPVAVTGYTPATTGGLYIVAYPTADTANFKVCNSTGSSITPGAITLNWVAVRSSLTIVASGTKALATGAISSATCTSTQTSTATGTATTDIIIATFNADPVAVTGYTPATTGGLSIVAYPTADTVNFKVCNNTEAEITPGSAITLNWKVAR